ncbi:MAG: DUF268 domain-containing protein [Verrucomicrobiae bacterium]|nr:DUF268 domain-containing protein [Verrucomicrobiae bacterium]
MSWKDGIRRHRQVHRSMKHLMSVVLAPWCRLRGKPPALIPRRLRAAFTLGGKIEVLYAYVDGSRAVPYRYSRERIAEVCRRVAAGEMGHYGGVDAWLYAALARYPIAGQRVAIMGSADQGYGPWYEGVCLHYGAQPVTVDYNPVEFEDERLQFMRAPVDLARVRPFDAALSISSFEHDGLGRYGEPLDPDGDLKAMQLMKRLIKPGGRLFLTVPVGRDKVVFNIHRIYGRLRLPLLLQGWKVEDRFGWEEAALDRDTGFGWEPVEYVRGKAGWEARLLHPGCPEYAPVWVLRNEPA